MEQVNLMHSELIEIIRENEELKRIGDALLISNFDIHHSLKIVIRC